MDNFYDDAEKVLKRIDEQVSLIVAKMKIDSKLDPEDIIFDNQISNQNQSKLKI